MVVFVVEFVSIPIFILMKKLFKRINFQENVPSLGFSPLMNTVQKMHDHDEYLNAETYLTGIKIYTDMIPKLASV